MKKLRVTVNGKVFDVEVELLHDDDEHGATYGTPMHSIRPQQAHAPKTKASAEISGPVKRPPSTDQKEITSPIAGTISEVKVREGQQVQENDLLMVIEAMKMNTHISSPISGEVKRIEVKESEGVRQGQVLLRFA